MNYGDSVETSVMTANLSGPRFERVTFQARRRNAIYRLLHDCQSFCVLICRLWWYGGYRACHWTQGSRAQT
jgi:hypothetical protein